MDKDFCIFVTSNSQLLSRLKAEIEELMVALC